MSKLAAALVLVLAGVVQAQPVGPTGVKLPAPNTKYAAANAALGAPAPGERRVVFFGSSSVQHWNLPKEFPGKPYVNRGISGENTRQMLARFDADTVALDPEAVLLHLGGVNDIGIISMDETVANVREMAERAYASGATPVILSPTPTNGTYAVSRPPAKMKALREKLRTLAGDLGCPFVDVFPLVADADGKLRTTLSSDGLHLNYTGYRLIRAAVQKGIDEALGVTSGGIIGGIGGATGGSTAQRAVLRYGSSGDDVKELQRKLTAAGFPLVVDGEFGPKTKAAVVAFQAQKGLLVDGIVGPQTWAALLKP